MAFHDPFNKAMPKALPGPEIMFCGRSWNAFHVFGCAALAVGVALNLGLGARLNVPWWTSVVTALLGVLTIPSVSMAAKIINGEEQLVFYHHLITSLGVTSAFLWLSGQPLLPSLDAFILAAGAIRGIGYFGCLFAGCCHGRPYRWGVVYREAYAKTVSRELLGVPLFPIQFVEALWTLGVVFAGCVLIVNPHAAGAGVGWFIAAYCPARFCFEFARWPPNYRFGSGLSQYQWISVALVLFVVCLELGGVLPFRLWHSLVLVLLVSASAVVFIERRLRSFDKALSHPDHLRELDGAIDTVWFQAVSAANTQMAPGLVPQQTTSLGLRVSASRISCETGDIFHYAFSSRSGRLTEEAANSLARLIVERKRTSARTEVLNGGRGVFHLLIYPTGG